jgi:hypothetical protein
MQTELRVQVRYRLKHLVEDVNGQILWQLAMCQNCRQRNLCQLHHHIVSLLVAIRLNQMYDVRVM